MNCPQKHVICWPAWLETWWVSQEVVLSRSIKSSQACHHEVFPLPQTLSQVSQTCTRDSLYPSVAGSERERKDKIKRWVYVTHIVVAYLHSWPHVRCPHNQRPHSMFVIIQVNTKALISHTVPWVMRSLILYRPLLVTCSMATSFLSWLSCLVGNRSLSITFTATSRPDFLCFPVWVGKMIMICIWSIFCKYPFLHIISGAC